ncbi:MAG: hypothetical protein ACXW3D_00390 [Caulobacteraceae bacterium]
MLRRLILSCAVLTLALSGGEALARPKKPTTPPPAAPAVNMAPPAAVKPTLASLTGSDDARIKAVFGVPDIARDEGAAALWTYRWPECALLVFFRRADGRTLRMSGAEANPRRSGQKPMTVDACIDHALAAPKADDARAIDALLDNPG